MGYMYKKITLLHSERPKLYTILAFLSAIGLKKHNLLRINIFFIFKGSHSLIRLRMYAGLSEYALPYAFFSHYSFEIPAFKIDISIKKFDTYSPMRSKGMLYCKWFYILMGIGTYLKRNK